MNLWKQKLAAYLHDPPSKCLDIAAHGERSDAAFRQAGFTDTGTSSTSERPDPARNRRDALCGCAARPHAAKLLPTH